jgi:riboflavin synthase alpha subunit
VWLDRTQVREIMEYLDNNSVILPNGGCLTVSRWQQLGQEFGMQGEPVNLIYIPNVTSNESLHVESTVSTVSFQLRNHTVI